jgi:aryl-alcohol dehydrogenase-like predicted oxidoreductase
MHLSVGTAQWGSGYGITNPTRRLDDAECAAIMSAARAAGMDAVDTALGYGDAQQRLRPWARFLFVTTKVSGRDVVQQTRMCLEQLDVEHVGIVLLHDWDALSVGDRDVAVRGLAQVQAEGLVDRVGVSVYDESGLLAAREVFASVELALGAVQVPANVLDRRLDDADVMRELVDSGTQLQVRSVFLQGLLAGPSDVALAAHPHVRAFYRWCADRNRDPLEVALAHVKALPWADEVIVGAASATQLQQIIDAWRVTSAEIADPGLASLDLGLIDPRRW